MSPARGGVGVEPHPARWARPGCRGAGWRPTDPGRTTMLRTLVAKAVVPVACTITGFVVVCCILLFASMKQDRIEENLLHATEIADVLARSTRYAMLQEDRDSLTNIVSNVGQERRVEHVRIFNKQGLVVFSEREGELGRYVDKEAEGCSVCHRFAEPPSRVGPMDQVRRYQNEAGEPVLAVTVAILNGPECAGQCHHHPVDQSVLGTLDIGLSEDGLRQSLALMSGRLVLFSAMVLVLSVGGVAALLRVTVLGPVRQLADYVEGLGSGERVPRPRGLSDELLRVAVSAEEAVAAPRRGQPRSARGA